MHHTPSAEDNSFLKSLKLLCGLFEKPVVWFRETVVEPNKQVYPWYHEVVRRVPTVDECYSNDVVCIYEADQQFRRDKMVEMNILTILKKRYESCNFYNEPDDYEMCRPLYDKWQAALTNFFIKYGDLPPHAGSKEAYMKQKHRMIWERRHGPVGTGMKDTSDTD